MFVSITHLYIIIIIVYATVIYTDWNTCLYRSCILLLTIILLLALAVINPILLWKSEKIIVFHILLMLINNKLF